MKSFRCFAYFFIILSLICVNTQTFAAVIHVPADQPTIQFGIDAAENGDTVLVADGIYKGEGNVNIDFKGKQITVKSQNGAEATIIDCERKPETRGFTFVVSNTITQELDGFTIKNGTHQKGGGIYCYFASPTIKNCVITQNQGIGGGIYCYNSSPLIEECKITQNRGSGVFLTGEWLGNNDVPKPVLIDCIISENTGSGISNSWRVTVLIRDCTISKNTARGVSCGEFTYRNLITNSRIEQNGKGGIEVSGNSHLKITESIIKQNTGSGIHCSRPSTIDVYECVIAENIDSRFGGGIYVESQSGKATITHCTITQNSAGLYGGGIYASVRTVFTLNNSIVWGNNSDGTHDEVYVSGSQIVIRSSDIGGGLKGIDRNADGEKFIYEDNIDKDPRFVNADIGDYRLKRNSPAAAMGPQSSVGGALSVAPVGKRLVQWGELKRNK